MTVMMKESLRHALGLLGVALLLMGAWTQGYRSAAAKTQVQPVVRADAARRDAEADLARARTQLKAVQHLVERYREEQSAEPLEMHIEEFNPTN